MKNIIKSFFATTIIAYSGIANAQTCTVAPTCETLGYNQTVAECKGVETVKCPFDTTKVFCGTVPPIYSVGDRYDPEYDIAETTDSPANTYISGIYGYQNPCYAIVVMNYSYSDTSKHTYAFAEARCKSSTKYGLDWRLPTSSGLGVCGVLSSVSSSIGFGSTNWFWSESGHLPSSSSKSSCTSSSTVSTATETSTSATVPYIFCEAKFPVRCK